MAGKPTLNVVIASETPAALVVKLCGEIRLDTRDADREFNRIAARRVPLTVVDFSECTFLSSLGMGLLVALRNGVVGQGRELRLSGLPPLILEAMKRARL